MVILFVTKNLQDKDETGTNIKNSLTVKDELMHKPEETIGKNDLAHVQKEEAAD